MCVWCLFLFVVIVVMSSSRLPLDQWECVIIQAIIIIFATVVLLRPRNTLRLCSIVALANAVLLQRSLVSDLIAQRLLSLANDIGCLLRCCHFHFHLSFSSDSAVFCFILYLPPRPYCYSRWGWMINCHFLPIHAMLLIIAFILPRAPDKSNICIA